MWWCPASIPSAQMTGHRSVDVEDSMTPLQDLQYRLGGGLGVLGRGFIFAGCVSEASRGRWARRSLRKRALKGP